MRNRFAFGLTVACAAIILAMTESAFARYRDDYPLPATVIPGTMGVNIHFTDPKSGEMSQLAGAGFRWIRMDFGWAGIEREKGRYDFSAYERLMAALKPHGIRPLFILDYGNDLYQEGSPRSPEAREAFTRFAAAAVSHFKGQGALWELWNEPNIFFWRPKPNVDEYIALAKAVGPAIRKAAPDEWFIGPATSGVDLNFIEKCLEAGLLRYWDAVSVHPYRNTPPETSIPDLRKLRDLVDRYAPKGRKIPLISGEWGYSELYPGLSLELQSRYLPRQILTNLMNGVILSIWYDWHDDGTDPKEIEHHFGTVTHDYKEKPTYVAARVLSRTLDGFRYNKRLALDSPDDYCLLFDRDSETRLAVWTSASGSHEATLPTGEGQFRIIDYLGNETGEKATREGLRLPLTGAPQYIVPASPSTLLSVAAGWSTLPSHLTVAGEEDLRKAVSPLTGGNWPMLSEPLLAHLTLVNERAEPAASLTAPLEIAPKGRRARIDRVPHSSYRGAEPTRFRATLTVAGFGTVSQEALLASKAPLSMMPVSPRGASLLLRIDNPTGEPFEGRVTAIPHDGADTAGELSVTPVAWKRGEREKTVAIPISASADRMKTELRLEEREKGAWRPVVSLPPMGWRRLSFPRAEGKECRALPDGDANIGSRITCETVSPPSGLPVDTERAVKVTYSFDTGWKFLRIPAEEEQRAMAADGETPVAFGIWVYGDASDNELRMRFVDSTGQTFQPNYGRIDWKGWRYVTFSLLGDNAGRWGGSDDGVVHPPILLDTLLLVDGGGRETRGEIHAAEPVVIYR